MSVIEVECMRQLNKVKKDLGLGRNHDKYVLRVKLLRKIDVKEELLQDNDKCKVLHWKTLKTTLLLTLPGNIDIMRQWADVIITEPVFWEEIQVSIKSMSEKEGLWWD